MKVTFYVFNDDGNRSNSSSEMEIDKRDAWLFPRFSLYSYHFYVYFSLYFSFIFFVGSLSAYKGNKNW